MKNRLVSLWILAFACIALAQSPDAFIPTGSMTVPRGGHTATLLTNGKVNSRRGFILFSPQVLDNRELYDTRTV
jgi:hypothetical protein